MRNFVFFFTAIFFSLLFCSCSSTKGLPEKKEVQMTPLTVELIENFQVTDSTLKQCQFYSSLEDTIIISVKNEKVSSQASDDGALILTGGSPVRENVILPGTPGILTKIIYDESKKIKELHISFSANKSNFLVYEPLVFRDSAEQFSQEETVFALKGSKFLTSGKNSKVYLVPFFLEEQDQQFIEPGQKINQSHQVTKVEKSRVKSDKNKNYPD